MFIRFIFTKYFMNSALLWCVDKFQKEIKKKFFTSIFTTSAFEVNQWRRSMYLSRVEAVTIYLQNFQLNDLIPLPENKKSKKKNVTAIIKSYGIFKWLSVKWNWIERKRKRKNEINKPNKMFVRKRKIKRNSPLVKCICGNIIRFYFFFFERRKMTESICSALKHTKTYDHIENDK